MFIDGRSTHAFAGLAYWEAYNLATGQLVAGIDAAGIRSEHDVYLATLVYRVRGSSEMAMVDVLHDSFDPAQRTFLFATPANGKVDVVETIPAVIRVDDARKKKPARRFESTPGRP